VTPGNPKRQKTKWLSLFHHRVRAFRAQRLQHFGSFRLPAVRWFCLPDTNHHLGLPDLYPCGSGMKFKKCCGAV
jgi:uncharacterized protein YchJ